MKLERVIAHWSVTTYEVDDDTRRHYHYIFDQNGREYLGFKRPEANISVSDRDYVGHTLNCNQGSIGVACAAMHGAISVDNYGDFPILRPQFEAMCLRIAKLCKRYGIPVTPRTVLMHGEVQKTLGIKQRGKWDIAVLPYAGLKTIEACGDYMRKLVSGYLANLK